MATTDTDLKVSTESVQVADERDAILKRLESLCRDCVNGIHATRKAAADHHASETALKAARTASDEEFADALKAEQNAQVAFIKARQSIRAIRDEVIRLRDDAEDRGWVIHVCFTAEGFPIRVAASNRTPSWGV